MKGAGRSLCFACSFWLPTALLSTLSQCLTSCFLTGVASTTTPGSSSPTHWNSSALCMKHVQHLLPFLHKYRSANSQAPIAPCSAQKLSPPLGCGTEGTWCNCSVALLGHGNRCQRRCAGLLALPCAPAASRGWAEAGCSAMGVPVEGGMLLLHSLH